MRQNTVPITRPQRGQTRLLNLGCGRRFHPDWVNVDVVSPDPHVIAHDLRDGIPFPDRSFDVVYHSHVLEHLPPEEARRFLLECCRVLDHGGTIRVAVPDLEQIVRLYLQALDRAREGDREWEHNYDWMLIELFDQTVRETTGGRHGTYLNRDDIPNVDFVLARQGKEVADSIEGQRLLRRAAEHPGAPSQPARRTLRSTLGRIRRGLRRLGSARGWSRDREARIARLLGDEYELLRLGRFRRSGEIHQWMYDSFSLSRALLSAGFVRPRRLCAGESGVDRWAEYQLDADAEGRAHKPDSLFMEAIKGGTSATRRG